MHDDGPSYIGARVDDQVILSYRTMEHKAPIGKSASAGKEIDLSFDEFIQLPVKWSKRVTYSRAS